jgi:hypothetical protein
LVEEGFSHLASPGIVYTDKQYLLHFAPRKEETLNRIYPSITNNMRRTLRQV